jgi:hypothetical protein
MHCVFAELKLPVSELSVHRPTDSQSVGFCGNALLSAVCIYYGREERKFQKENYFGNSYEVVGFK